MSVSVPDVTGMTQDEATAALADAGLVAVPVEAYVADVPEGEVAEQEPAAGDRVSPLSEVLDHRVARRGDDDCRGAGRGRADAGRRRPTSWRPPASP